MIILHFIRKRRQKIEETEHVEVLSSDKDGAVCEQVAALDHSYHMRLPDCNDVFVGSSAEHVAQEKSGSVLVILPD